MSSTLLSRRSRDISTSSKCRSSDYHWTRGALPSMGPAKRLKEALDGKDARLRPPSLTSARCISPTRPGGVSVDERTQRKLELIRAVCRYLGSELRLDLPGNFYREWSGKPSQSLIYLYVSYKDRIEPPDEFVEDAAPGRPYRGFGPSETAAHAAEQYWRARKFDTLLYRTVASRSAKISYRLLRYEDSAIVFVVAHEALHVHLRKSGIKIPYDYEEALADWVGLQVVLGFSKCRNELREAVTLDADEAVRFVDRMEKFHSLICEVLQGEAASLARIQDAWDRAIAAEHTISAKAPSIFIDRFGFSVFNKAFLLRYSAYCAKYFHLKSVLCESGGEFNPAFENLHRWLKKIPDNIGSLG